MLQLIVQLAREADKDGNRTIGVLTKADMIEAGTHDTWLPVLQVGCPSGTRSSRGSALIKQRLCLITFCVDALAADAATTDIESLSV
jgi:hypothetical protein